MRTKQSETQKQGTRKPPSCAATLEVREYTDPADEGVERPVVENPQGDVR